MSTQQSNERERKNLEKQYTYEEPDEGFPANPNVNPSSGETTEWERYLDGLDEARQKYIADLAKQNEYKIGNKTYERRKIRVKDFNTLEKLRARFRKERDPENAADILIDVYAKCAEFYLGMPMKDYENVDDWDTIKLILDACSFRSFRGLPN